MLNTREGIPSYSQSHKKHKSLYSTFNETFSTPKKSLFKAANKTNSQLKKSVPSNSKSPLSFLTLPSKLTRNKKDRLIRLDTDTINNDEQPINKVIKSQVQTFAFLDKIKPTLPVLTKPSALNNFIIRGFKPSEETNEYIQSTKTKQKVSNEFFALKQHRIKMKTKNQIETFERIKKCTVFISDSYAYRANYNDKEYSRRLSGDEIHSIEESNKLLIENKIRTEGKNMADMVLNLEKNENLKPVEEFKSNIEVSFRNLQNAIALRRILKGKGRYNEEDETLGISNVNQLRHDRNMTEYEMMKTLKQFKEPKFLKSKFAKDTVRQFRGVNGKFFGVIC